MPTAQTKRIPRGDLKQLLDVKTIPSGAEEWTRRWLQHCVEERSYPPQMAGADALNAIGRFLAPSVGLLLLTDLRTDFLRAFPEMQPVKEDLSFLTEALRAEGKDGSDPLRME